MVSQLVLIRHGHSVYNEKDKFTGWEDVELTSAGLQEAVKASCGFAAATFKGTSPSWLLSLHCKHGRALQAGNILKAQGFKFDVAFTSVLKRCIVSLHTILEEAEQLWIPEQKCWRLNERHYGDLQDQVKSEVAETVGEQQAKDWRRSYVTRPPGVSL